MLRNHYNGAVIVKGSYVDITVVITVSDIFAMWEGVRLIILLSDGFSGQGNLLEPGMGVHCMKLSWRWEAGRTTVWQAAAKHCRTCPLA